MTDDDIKGARGLLRAWNEAGARWGSISMVVDFGRTLDALEASRAQVAALTVERDEARAVQSRDVAAVLIQRTVAERDAAIMERDELRKESPVVLRAERDAALARAELAEKQAVASSTMCDEWQDRFLEAWARAIQAEAKLAALMPLVQWHRAHRMEGGVHYEACERLAALDKEATP